MSRFLAELSAALAPDAPAVTRPAGTGPALWPSPGNLTLVPLPPHGPVPDPVERIGPYLRERCLSHRILGDCNAVVDAGCHAWTALTQQPGRIRSLTRYPWLPSLSS